MKLILIWIAKSGSTISNINSTACYQIYKSDNIIITVNKIFVNILCRSFNTKYSKISLSLYKIWTDTSQVFKLRKKKKHKISQYLYVIMHYK